VTLARSPWVTRCCDDFYPEVGRIIKELGIKTVYAQEGVQIDYNKVGMMASKEQELHWAGVKGKAIRREIAAFYQQYEGQSWKNIISIGDSDFERLGTFQAIEQYLAEKHLLESGSQPLHGKIAEFGAMTDKENHVIHVRSKILRMIDMPSPEELMVQLEMVTRWIVPMVFLDGGCDFAVDELEDKGALQSIEKRLSDVEVPKHVKELVKESAAARGAARESRKSLLMDTEASNQASAKSDSPVASLSDSPKAKATAADSGADEKDKPACCCAVM
jgi:hypothetical protein